MGPQKRILGKLPNACTLYTCQLFLSQRHEIFFLPVARVSEDDPTIAEDFWKLLRKF